MENLSQWEGRRNFPGVFFFLFGDGGAGGGRGGQEGSMGVGNLASRGFDHSNLFQSQKQHPANIEH